uniref:Uncharacterized protein n=1 Tax=Odontella aurita TaxID=265563 RepID=A0A7S4M6R9_9STRA|mmetsp:Transcript_12371/g.36345  ORF Transcript_12371/g.36345 Transcript_12371/m.36345 type:complete len:231 (+) Transcript_12371:505-1197(+)
MDRPWDYNEGYEVGAPPPGGRKGGTDDVRVIPITTLPHSRIVGSGGTGGGNDIASSKYASFVLGGGSAASAPSPLAREAGGGVRSLLLSFAAGLGWHLSHALAGYLQSLSAGAADDDSGRSSRGKDGEEDDTSEEESSRRRVATALAERLRGKIYAAWRDALIRLRRGASDAYAIAGAGGIDWPLVLVFGAAVLWRGRGAGRQGGPGGGGGGGDYQKKVVHQEEAARMRC